MATLEEKIISDPAASQWLKKQVVESAGRDVLDALRDSETLVEVLKARFSEAVKC